MTEVSKVVDGRRKTGESESFLGTTKASTPCLLFVRIKEILEIGVTAGIVTLN